MKKKTRHRYGLNLISYANIMRWSHLIKILCQFVCSAYDKPKQQRKKSKREIVKQKNLSFINCAQFILFFIYINTKLFSRCETFAIVRIKQQYHSCRVIFANRCWHTYIYRICKPRYIIRLVNYIASEECPGFSVATLYLFSASIFYF